MIQPQFLAETYLSLANKKGFLTVLKLIGCVSVGTSNKPKSCNVNNSKTPVRFIYLYGILLSVN